MKAEPISGMSRPRLMMKLRRVGGFFALFILLVLASVHWLADEIEAVLAAPGVPRQLLKTQIMDALERVNLVVAVAGLCLIPVFWVAAVLAARFVRQHFAQIEDASRRKTEFVRFVAHEMRTPLNAINGFAQVLSRGPAGTLTADQADSVHEIQAGANNLKRLINDILDLAKVESGTVELSIGSVPITRLLGTIAAGAGPLASAKRLQVVVAGPAELTATGDSHRVHQVCLNLLSNAIKFSAEGGSIELGAVRQAAEVLVTVTDHGAGISPEDQAELFEDYRQVSGRAGSTEGTGLGLAISKRLVELMGGRIWMTSAPGLGTQISFTLPAGRESPGAEREAAAARAHPAGPA